MKKKLLILVLTLTMVLSSIITVMASETLANEIPLTEIEEDVILEEDVIEAANSFLCPYCDRGSITRTKKTYLDETAHYSMSGSCGQTGYHIKRWSFDITTITCDYCSHHTETKGSRYNVHCVSF